MLGPNGCENYFIFNLYRRTNPEGGKVYLNNKSIEQIPIHLRSRRLGYLPQQKCI